MRSKKSTKFERLRAGFVGFLVLIGMIIGVGGAFLNARSAYAVEQTTDTVQDELPTADTDGDEDTEKKDEETDEEEDKDEKTKKKTKKTDEENNQVTTSNSNNKTTSAVAGDLCKSGMGALGWVVCPVTNKIAEAVDWLYDKIEQILVINPISSEEGSPIYEIWKYCRGVTNIVFIIVFLIVIYSQITGWGISNYGLKKLLPKLIVMAILVNLSFLICSVGVDLSNVIGHGLRSVFDSVQETVLSNSNVEASSMVVPMAEAYTAMAGGTALAVGAGTIAFELGSLWMLIPVALGAIVAVVTGLITVALRQAVVALLVMIAPLAFVANILPNTEGLFQKWKKLLIRMLVFYPMFSLLFGASSLAGFAIIASAKDAFWLLVGMAVQIFPLFFSWKMMQMSGTFLGDINTKMRSLAAGPLATNRAWADSRRQLTRAKTLASGRTPSARLMQFLSNRKIAREEETSELLETSKLRGQAYAARRNYRGKGDLPSREGEEAYLRQARNLEYQKIINRHQNNMNKGLGQLEAVKLSKDAAMKSRLTALDNKTVKASDSLKMESARGEKIEYENAMSFHTRMENAINSHFDDLNSGNPEYKRHTINNEKRAEARARYSAAKDIMEGDIQGIHYAAATAAHGYDTQKKIVETKMGKYFELTPPTRDVEYRLGELTSRSDAPSNVDSIIAGLRVLNQRGDTDLVKKYMNELLSQKVQLGSHASQALASFLMFEVKDSDPWLRRFGKYINLETANVFNKNKRKVMDVTYDEYVRGYHDEPDLEKPGQTKRMYAKKGMAELLQGTSLDNIERTALSSYDESLIAAYTKNGKLNYKDYIEKRSEIDKAFGPAFISANLKYLSGSEQIANAVKSKTGYEAVQNPDNGTYTMQPIWEISKYRGVFDGHIDELKKWYRDGTLKYLEDQTPSQILGLRSDYRVPLEQHLESAYMDADTSEWSEEAIEERNEIMKEWSDLQTKYGDLSTEDARKEYEAEASKIKKKMVGAQFRQLLDAKGKLNQIYRTRRSGAANNAKDWVREWLDLDNDLSVTMKLEDDKRKLKQEYEKLKREKNKKQGVPQNTDTASSTSRSAVYSESDRASFVSHVDDLWYELRDDSDEEFYEESLKYLEKTLGEDSFIVTQYKRFRKDDPYADSHMLKEYVLDLLNDPDNY